MKTSIFYNIFIDNRVVASFEDLTIAMLDFESAKDLLSGITSDFKRISLVDNFGNTYSTHNF